MSSSSSSTNENNNSSSNNSNDNNHGSSRSNTVRSFKVMDVLRAANELQQKLDREQQDISNGNDTDAAATEKETVREKCVLHLEVGQPETGAPKTVANAAIEALTMTTLAKNKNVMGYTDAFGLLELRQRIRQHYIDKYKCTATGQDDEPKSQMQIPDVSQIVVTTGSSGAFLLAFTAFFDAGDTVAIASSGYPCYRNILQALGCEIATIAINDEYKITSKELKREIEERKKGGEYKPIKGLILSSPSNPTGSMLTPSEIRELCQLCNQENIIFMSDEIYHGISYGNVPEATALQYATADYGGDDDDASCSNNNTNVNENIVIINSFSKYYSMPGWRLGWMVVPPRFVQAINKLQQNMFINAPTVSQTAALKCWDEDTIRELESHVTKYRANRELILSRFDSSSEKTTDDVHSNTGDDGTATTFSVLKGLTLEKNVAPADGGFYVYVDLGENNICIDDDAEQNLDSVTMCEELLARYYVAFTPGIDFEDPNCSKRLGHRRFRISYAGGTENIRKAMDKFTEFWNTFWLVKISNANKE